jgi:hypothetical protein
VATCAISAPRRAKVRDADGEEEAMLENARTWRTAIWLAELAAGNHAHGSTARRGSNRPGELATPDSGRRRPALTGVRSRTLVKPGFTLLREGQNARAEDASTGGPMHAAYGKHMFPALLLFDHHAHGAPVTDRRAMSLSLSEAEMDVLEQLAARKDLSKTAVLRQALRLYQLVDERLMRGEKLFLEDETARTKSELMLL